MSGGRGRQVRAAVNGMFLRQALRRTSGSCHEGAVTGTCETAALWLRSDCLLTDTSCVCEETAPTSAAWLAPGGGFAVAHGSAAPSALMLACRSRIELRHLAHSSAFLAAFRSLALLRKPNYICSPFVHSSV